MPDDKLFFSKLVTKDLSTVDSSRRLFEGILTVEMKDRQGEITIRDELLKVLPIWIARGGPITDTHSNRVVGQGINFGSTTVKDSNGHDLPAISITGEIFRDYELDNEIWNAIKSGKYKGLSFGGATKTNRTPITQSDGSIAYSLKDLEQYEVAVCEEPAVPLALITQHNNIAKALAGNVKDRGDGTMCIRCDKFKCYVEKDSLVKIEDDEDDDTQVTVLDEWKNETHPDKNGKTEGIRTTKGDDTFSDVTDVNTPQKDEDSEALENNRGEPQENGATYHGTDKGRKVNYRDPNPTELDPSKIMDNAETAGKQIQSFEKGRSVDDSAEYAEVQHSHVDDKPGTPKIKDEKAMDVDDKELLDDAGLEEEKKEDVNNPGSSEYDQTNEAGEKVNRFGRKIPNVMSKKPSNEPEAKPQGRLTSPVKVRTGQTVAESRAERGEKAPGMSDSALRARQTRANQPKVGGKKIKPGPTVTHDHKTGMTTIDNSTSRGGAQGVMTIPTERYISNFTSKSLDILTSILKIKIGPVTTEARRGLIQDTKIPGTTGNQNKLGQEAAYIREGTKIKPTGSDSKFTDADVEAMKAQLEQLKSDYNTDSVVREYTEDEKMKKENLEKDSTSNNHYVEVSHGGNAGREPGETCDTNESTSIHNVNQPKHVNEPTNEEGAKGLQKEADLDKPKKFTGTCNRLAGEETHPIITQNKKNEDPCWEGYEALGMKDQGGKKVPNCVKKAGDDKRPLNKPMRDDGNKKFKVYVRDPSSGNIVTVRFGDPNMEIKRDSPERRSSFRARHKCSEQKDITSAAYWSCKMWEKSSSVSDNINKTNAELWLEKNDRAMTANNAEDGVNGKMRLDNDEPAEVFEEDDVKKDTSIADPGSGSGGVRSGASYDNAQQDTGAKDNPRQVVEEHYTGEEDSVTGTDNEKKYNKSLLKLNSMLFHIKTQL